MKTHEFKFTELKQILFVLQDIPRAILPQSTICLNVLQLLWRRQLLTVH